MHTDEENDVLRLLGFLEVSHHPVGNSLGAVVVGECSNVLSWLVERNLSVDLGCNIDMRCLLLVLGEEVLVPFEVPFLNFWLSNLEVGSGSLSSGSGFGNRKSELLIRNSTIRLGAVDWSMDLQANIEVLACEEVGLVRWEDTTQSYIN